MASFDVEKARNAGYSDQEIQSYMASKNLSPKFSLGGLASNIGKSAVKFGGDILSAPKSLWNLGKGLVTGETTLGETGSAFGQSLKDRYGGLDEIARTLYFDPVGLLADVSVGAGAIGAGAKLGKLGKVSNVASKVSRATDPFRLVGKASKVATSPFAKVGKGIEEFGNEYLIRGMGNPKLTKQISKQIKSSGLTPTEFFNKYPDLYAKSPELAQQTASTLGKQYGQGIREISSTSLKTSDLFNAYDKAIKRLKEVGKSNADEVALKQANALESRLNVLKGSFGKQEFIAPEQFQKVAQAVDKTIPDSKFLQSQAQLMGQPVGASMRERNILRGTLRQYSPTLRQTGKDISITKNLGKLYQGAADRGIARQPINFTKLGSAGVGSVVAGVPGAIAGYGLERVANSPIGARAISTGATKIGQSLQGKFVPQLPKRVSSVASGVYGGARATRFALPSSQNTSRYTNPNIPQRESSGLEQEKTKLPAYKPTIAPIAPKIKSTMPTAESFYAEIRKKRGY